jgi:lysophospholipase L1-like esterase
MSLEWRKVSALPKHVVEIAEYIALGDSMSIDLYPALDAGETDVSVALEWDAHAGVVAPLGAASLLVQNVDDRWPEFTGRDLRTLYGDVAFMNVAEDGATIGDVFGSQLPQLESSDAPTLVTLTVGGNDLLSAFANKPVASLLRSVVRDIAEAYEFLVESVSRTRPNSTIVLATVYDPSDDTKKIPGVFDGAGPLPLDALHEFNDRVRGVAVAARRGIVADVYRHFQGHGVTAMPADRWYWSRSWIEPNAMGASEIRRLWLDAIATAAED